MPKSGTAVRGRARQADSEDTVTISSQGTPDDGTETDDESAPAKRVSQFSFYLFPCFRGSEENTPCQVCEALSQYHMMTLRLVMIVRLLKNVRHLSYPPV